MLHLKGQINSGGKMKKILVSLFLLSALLLSAAQRQFVLFEVGTGTW